MANKYTDDEKKNIVAEFKKSGLSRKDFCEQKGINAATFGRWLNDSRISGEAAGDDNKDCFFDRCRLSKTDLIKKDNPGISDDDAYSKAAYNTVSGLQEFYDINTWAQIKAFDKPKLNGVDTRNNDNNQTFTREKDVKTMIKETGVNEFEWNADDSDNGNLFAAVLPDFKTVLEPTSGDGAFTVRILEGRLESINYDHFLSEMIREGKPTASAEDVCRRWLQASLLALSRIYSVECAANTCYDQRCNMYTVMINQERAFERKSKVDVAKISALRDDWNSIAKRIIFSNVMWGFATTQLDVPNSDAPVPYEYWKYDRIVGFSCANGQPLSIIKWSIRLKSNDKFDVSAQLIGCESGAKYKRKKIECEFEELTEGGE